jgi:hypothetical protein
MIQPWLCLAQDTRGQAATKKKSKNLVRNHNNSSNRFLHHISNHDNAEDEYEDEDEDLMALHRTAVESLMRKYDIILLKLLIRWRNLIVLAGMETSFFEYFTNTILPLIVH